MYKICLERQQLFDVNMIVTMKVTVSGKYSEKQFTEAFAKANASFETLSMHIVIHQDGNAFFEKYDKPYHSISFGNYSLETLIQTQERIRFRLEDGEFIRCFVSETLENETDIYFMMHHIAGDGKSLLYYIESFLTALSGDTAEYNNFRLKTADNLPKDSGLSLIERSVVNFSNLSWSKEKTVFNFSHMQKAYEHFWADKKTEVLLHEISTSELEGVLNLCRENDIRFTSYALSKIISGTTDTHHIGIAVSDRPDGNKSMSNQVTGVDFRFAYKNNLSVLENAKEIDREISHKFDNPKLKYFILQIENALAPTLVDAINFECAGTFHSKSSSKLCNLIGFGEKAQDICITNLTNIEIPVQYGNIRINDLWFVPPVVSYGKNIVGIITVNGKLNVTFHRYKKSQNT